MANDMIRMSGMNSGLDTESIINALTANSKLKVTKQERNVLKYQATQEAYQDVSSKITALKNKYFDVLNKDSNLSGTSLWNKYSSTTYVEGEEKFIAGFSASTTINSQTGDYKMKIKNTAKQSTVSGKSLSGSAKISDSDLKSFTKGQTVGFTVNVGGEEKNITFTAGGNAIESRRNLNQALEDAFGESNESVGDAGNKGMVYTVPGESAEFYEWAASNPKLTELGKQYGGTGNIYTWASRCVTKPENATVNIPEGDDATRDEIIQQAAEEFAKFKDYYAEKYNGMSEGQLVSRSGKGVTMGGFSAMTTTNSLDLSKAETGNNTISIQVGNESVSVSFQTIKTDYFQSAIDNGIIDPATGNTVGITDTDEEGNNIRFTKATALAISELSKDGYEPTEEEINARTAEIRSEWSAAVTLYKDVTADIKEAARYDSFKSWLPDKETDPEGYEAKVDLLYQSALKTQEKTLVGSWLENDSGIKTAYDDYKAGLAEGETADDIYTWAENSAEEGVQETFKTLTNKYNGTLDTDEQLQTKYNDYVSGLGDGEEAKSYDNWKKDYQESQSYKLDKNMWSSSESNLFTTYKGDKNFYNEETASYNLSAENVVNHYNKSVMKNSIGALETASGVKFDVTVDSDNNAVISAYKESTDENGDPVRTDVAMSLTIAKGSANYDTEGIGAVQSTSVVSQISNQTKISDLGLSPGEDGMYSFKINDQSFSFDGNTTINDMMKKINASSAGVKMTYSSLDNAFTVTSNKYGVDSSIKIEDGSSGLLSTLGLEDGTVKNGSNLVMEVNGKLVESDGNSVEVDGTTFTFNGSDEQVGKEFTVTIGRDTSAIADVIKGFVKEYNQLIEDVYKYLDEKPEKDYYFLADQDKEDLDLSDKQEEKWEEKAKKGLLYHDSTVSNAMSKLRTALMGSVEGLDGNTFSLSSLGLKTATDYSKHGTLVLDEDALMKAIENNTDDVQKLFTDSENGIMKKFSDALNAAVGTTGETKGTLVRKAGLKSGTSSTDNELYNLIKRTKTNIATLTKRYENEQDRLWKRYSAMESMMGTLNSQQSSFNSYFGGM